MNKLEAKNIELSAIIIPLMEVKSVIQPIRSKETVDGAKGLIPHITVLYPFYKEIEPLKAAVKRMDLLSKKIRSFKVTLTSLQRFTDHGVLYLAPEPQNEILNAIKTVCKEYPEYQPYDGNIPMEKIIPHATVAVNKDCEVLDEIEAELLTDKKMKLPIEIEVNSFWLVVKSNDRWYQYKELNLAK